MFDEVFAEAWENGFPSPCGDVVLKYWLDVYVEALGEGFPSPCGDVVLK